MAISLPQSVMRATDAKPRRRSSALATLYAESLLDACLQAFLRAGTLDLSLDQLAAEVGSSKRMLVHYFGGKQSIEEQSLDRLEEALRGRFRVENIPRGADLPAALNALWDQCTRPEARNTLLLVMDVTRRAWLPAGSERAREFYREQQRIWINLLYAYSPDEALVTAAAHLFEGALIAYLVNHDREQGRQSLAEFFRGWKPDRVELRRAPKKR